MDSLSLHLCNAYRSHTRIVCFTTQTAEFNLRMQVEKKNKKRQYVVLKSFILFKIITILNKTSHMGKSSPLPHM